MEISLDWFHINKKSSSLALHLAHCINFFPISSDLSRRKSVLFYFLLFFIYLFIYSFFRGGGCFVFVFFSKCVHNQKKYHMIDCTYENGSYA